MRPFLFPVEKDSKVIRISSSDVAKFESKKGFNENLYEEKENLTNLDLHIKKKAHKIDLDLPEELLNRMFDHQKEGVRWMYDLRLNYTGGILGDDMGLGKTFQTASLITGLIRSNLAKKFLIISPVTVMPSWIREIEQHVRPHVKKITIQLINADIAKNKRQKLIKHADTTIFPCVSISSYQLVSNMIDDFSELKWDYVILDEGHTIKNPATKLTQAVHRLNSDYRLLLTGTPVQNKLKELWVLVDWVTKGRLLGSSGQFSLKYVEHIVKGQDPKASQEQVVISQKVANSLMHTIRPILLQRKKCENIELLKLPDKTELVIWIPLSSQQRNLYEEFLKTGFFKEILLRSTYPIDIVNHLKTLCRHPLLLEASKAMKIRKDSKNKSTTATNNNNSFQSTSTLHPGFFSSQNKPRTIDTSHKSISADVDDLISDINKLTIKKKQMPPGQQIFSSHNSQRNNEIINNNDDDDDDDGRLQQQQHQQEQSIDTTYAFDPDDGLPANSDIFDIIGRTPNIDEIFSGSIKLRVLVKVVKKFRSEGHKTLVFSQSKLMHDLIQTVLAEFGIASSRIDGSISYKDRQGIIDDFNDPASNDVSVCLLTTRACGYGITLTGADRVIIFDPSWNPAEDRQAVDRAFRIGQTKNVIVYRMIMASAIEEKMYEKQVFKDGLRIVTESGVSSKYFSSEETKDLFKLGPKDKSLVMEKIWGLCNNEKMTSFSDIKEDTKGILGFSRHDNLYAEVRPEHIQSRQSIVATNDDDEDGDSELSRKDRVLPPPREKKQPKLPSSHSSRTIIDLSKDTEEAVPKKDDLPDTTKITIDDQSTESEGEGIWDEQAEGNITYTNSKGPNKRIIIDDDDDDDDYNVGVYHHEDHIEKGQELEQEPDKGIKEDLAITTSLRIEEMPSDGKGGSIVDDDKDENNDDYDGGYCIQEINSESGPDPFDGNVETNLAFNDVNSPSNDDDDDQLLTNKPVIITSNDSIIGEDNDNDDNDDDDDDDDDINITRNKINNNKRIVLDDDDDDYDGNYNNNDVINYDKDNKNENENENDDNNNNNNNNNNSNSNIFDDEAYEGDDANIVNDTDIKLDNEKDIELTNIHSLPPFLPPSPISPSTSQIKEEFISSSPLSDLDTQQEIITPQNEKNSIDDIINTISNLEITKQEFDENEEAVKFKDKISASPSESSNSKSDNKLLATPPLLSNRFRSHSKNDITVLLQESYDCENTERLWDDLSEENKTEVFRLLDTLKNYEEKYTTTNPNLEELEKMAEILLSALEICDDRYILHEKLAKIYLLISMRKVNKLLCGLDSNR